MISGEGGWVLITTFHLCFIRKHSLSLQSASLQCTLIQFSVRRPKIALHRLFILGHPGADSGGERKSKRAENMAQKKSKERREEPLGTMSYQTSSKQSPPFWLLIGARKLVFFWHQSEARFMPLGLRGCRLLNSFVFFFLFRFSMYASSRLITPSSSQNVKLNVYSLYLCKLRVLGHCRLYRLWVSVK